MKEVFISCTIIWIPFIVLGICAFVKYLRRKPEHDKMEMINPFEESDKLIEHAMESYFEIMEGKECISRECSNSSKSNLLYLNESYIH